MACPWRWRAVGRGILNLIHPVALGVINPISPDFKQPLASGVVYIVIFYFIYPSATGIIAFCACYAQYYVTFIVFNVHNSLLVLAFASETT